MELIDKATIVTEIERRINKEIQNCAAYNGYSQGCVDSMRDVLSFLDTLEVKEVDLNKENKNLKMLLDVIDYSFLQTDGSYDKSLTYPVIDKVLFIKKNII